MRCSEATKDAEATHAIHAVLTLADGARVLTVATARLPAADSRTRGESGKGVLVGQGLSY